MSKTIIQSLKDFKGTKIQFIQDDYRNVNNIINRILELGINYLFTSLKKTTTDVIYKKLTSNKVKVISTLTGYMPQLKSNKCIKWALT